MIISSRLLLTGTMIATLTACGGGGGTSGPSELDEFKDRFDSAEAQVDRLQAMSLTGRAYMPATGSASFTGTAGIIIDPVEATDRDDIVILGTSRMTANFNRGTMTGSITDMTAATNLTETGADIHNVNGSIRLGIGESVIGDDVDDNRTNAHNQWYADYVGTLRFDGDRYDVGGAVDGVFLGNRVNASGGQSSVRGILGVDEDGYASINGNIEEVPMTLELTGEN